MYARCQICAKTWNISISQKIPKQGYNIEFKFSEGEEDDR